MPDSTTLILSEEENLELKFNLESWFICGYGLSTNWKNILSAEIKRACYFAHTQE